MAPAADAHAMDMSIIKPFLGMQEPQDSNLYFDRVGVGPPIRWLIPKQVAVLQPKRKPPGGISPRAAPGIRLTSLSGNLPDD